MKLILIRHGQSIGNTKVGYISGRSDPDGLSQLGRLQIARTAYELRDLKVDAIISSPVARAKESAKILNLQFNTKIESVEWLTELHHGMFEGNFWWEIIHKIPTNWRKNREDFHSAYPGGGESVADIIGRVSVGYKEFVSIHSEDKTYLMITHEAVITALRFCIFHGFSDSIESENDEKKATEFFHKTRLPNAGFIVVDVVEKSPKIVREVSNLPVIAEDRDNVKLYVKSMTGDPKIEIEKIETASKNTVYHVKGSSQYLFKIYNKKDTAVAKRQITLYNYLASHNISAPKMKFDDISRVFFKGDVIVQDYMDGISLDHCLKDHPKNIGKILTMVYKELSKIHNLNKNEVSKFWISPVEDQFQTWKPYMTFNINMTLHMLEELGLESEKVAMISDKLEGLKKYLKSDEYRLVPIHGDLASGNIIIDHKNRECKFIRLIDFEWARIGDPLWDLAYFWGWLERKNAEVALLWKKIISDKLTADELNVLDCYRILFHTWTVRDLVEYKGEPFRERRGKKSREILETN